MQALRVAYLHLGRDRGIASSTASKLSVKRDHHTCSVPNEHVLILPRRRTVALNEDVTKTVEVVGREVKTDANESIVAKDVQTVDPDGTDTELSGAIPMPLPSLRCRKILSTASGVWGRSHLLFCRSPRQPAKSVGLIEAERVSDDEWDGKQENGGCDGSLSNHSIPSAFLNASHPALCVACPGIRSHAVPVALVGECSIPVV